MKPHLFTRHIIRTAACLGTTISALAQFHPATVPGFEPEESLSLALPGLESPAVEAFDRLPLSFEPNQGQADPEAKFLVRGRGFQLQLEQTEAVMLVAPGTENAKRPGVRQPSAAFERDRSVSSSSSPGGPLKAPEVWRTPSPGGASCAPSPSAVELREVRTRLLGSNPLASMSGEEELPGKMNYFIGNDPARWRTNIPTFAKVRYREVYPGIDLVYYGHEGQLEYDFIVAPGAEPNRIELAVEGADEVDVTPEGDLRLTVGGRELRWRKPVLFQDKEGVRIPVEGGFIVGSAQEGEGSSGRTVQRVAFHVASYDRSLALVIDPVLAYSTYLGGGLADWAKAIAVDAEGSAYVTGLTWSASGYGNFPTTANAVMRSFRGNGAAFVTKFSPQGNALIYSTVLGGTPPRDESDPEYFAGSDGRAIRVDREGRATVLGSTGLSNFPVKNATQPQYGGGNSDAYVAQLSADGASLLYSTFLGGSDYDTPMAMALDSKSDLYVAGRTRSPDFPTANAAQAELRGGSDAFVVKLAGDGSQSMYSTYVGGDGEENDGVALAVDAEGRAWVAATIWGESDTTVLLARLKPNGTQFEDFRTNIFGVSAQVQAMAIGPSGNLFLTGETRASNLPVTPDAFRTAFAGGYYDVFVGKLNLAGSAFEYLTYLGGTNIENVSAITIDPDGHAYVAGETRSGDFPTQNAIQPAIKSKPTDDLPADGFVCKLSVDGRKLEWSTYLGGSPAYGGQADGSDRVYGLALDSAGALYLAGSTASANFPIAGAYQTTLKRLDNWMAVDGFVAKVTEPPAVLPSAWITRSDTAVSITWPAAATGFVLEVADSLSPASSWSPASTTPSVIADQNVVTLEIGGGPKFFRLRKP